MPFIKGKKPWNLGKKMPFTHRIMKEGFLPIKAFKKGNIPWNKGSKGSIPWNKGKTGTQGSNGGSFGSRKPKFIGTKKEYFALHYWVRKELGKPTNCQQCGINKNIEWANISNTYKKDLLDWISLCRRCHYQYDKVDERRIKNIERDTKGKIS